jgi:transcriptional regulator with XRE-family HTH domain
MDSSFGKNIKKYRTDAGFTLEQLARAAGITKGYLWQLEEGTTSNPTLQTLQGIAKALDKTIAQLLFGGPLVKPAMHPIELTELPESLKTFINRQNLQNRPLTNEDIQVLANIHYRGQRPTTEEDWDMLYSLIKRISV